MVHGSNVDDCLVVSHDVAVTLSIQNWNVGYDVDYAKACRKMFVGSFGNFEVEIYVCTFPIRLLLDQWFDQTVLQWT